MTHRLLAIVTDEMKGPEPVEEIRRAGNGDGVELRIVVPAVEVNALHHTLGDVDEPRAEAEERLGRVLATLRGDGIEATGEVGDPDPIQAAQDALLKAPADEVLIFEHEDAQARWFEQGMFEKAQAGLDPPLRLVVLHDEDDGTERVVEVETAGRGTVDPVEATEVGAAYGAGVSRPDFIGMVMGIVGTIAAAVLAAAVFGGDGNSTGAQAAAVLIAIGIALVNMAHVVGLLLMDSVRYHGGFAKFFRSLAIFGTPVAVLANLLILLFA